MKRPSTRTIQSTPDTVRDTICTCVQIAALSGSRRPLKGLDIYSYA